MRSDMTRPRVRRVASVFAVGALVLTLALGGCRTGARQGNPQAAPQTQSGAPSTSAGGAAGASTGSPSSSTFQQLQSVDNQNQSDSQQLNAAQNDAGVNYSSQENQTQP